MNWTAFVALVRRDLRLFVLDKRAMVMSFVAPIVIGSFFGYLFGGVTKDREAAKIPVAVVDLDGSALSKRLAASLAGEPALEVEARTAEKARASVRAGKTTVAAVIPAGFGAGAVAGLMGGAKPQIDLLYDPSHATELAMVRGLLAQHVMASIGEQVAGGRRFTLPFTVADEAVTARKGVAYNGMAHSFAGMSVQFVLFMGIDAGLIVLAQRRTGMWKRLQAAPVSRFLVIGSRATSATLIALSILAAVFGFARLVFDVKIEGSMAGMIGVCAAFALMTATFGLLVAVLGKTPEGTRGISILVTLVLVMLGGSWVPTFIFPQWLQRVTVVVPTRWAVDGLDAMIWRGLGMEAAWGPIAALLGFALVFGLFAVWRFRWQDS